MRSNVRRPDHRRSQSVTGTASRRRQSLMRRRQQDRRGEPSLVDERHRWKSQEVETRRQRVQVPVDVEAGARRFPAQQVIDSDLPEQCAEVEVGLQRHMVEPVPCVFADRLRTRQAAGARRPLDEGDGEAPLAEPPCQRHPEHASTDDAHRRRHASRLTHPSSGSALRQV